MSGEVPNPADAERARRRAERERRRDAAARQAEGERGPGAAARQAEGRRRPGATARRARTVARRRALALGALAVAALAVVAVALGTRGPGPAPAHHAGAAGAAVAVTHRRHAGGLVGPVISGAAARRASVPILMYHVIAAPPPGTPYPELWVPPQQFRAQMRALAAAGYRGVTLAAAFAAWRHGAQLPAKPIVVSFDDGYRSHSAAAAPVLRKLGWPGVLNLEVHNAGPEGISLRRLHGLVHDGWEIDSHTVDHPDLTALPAAAVRDELVRSRAWIHARLGQPADFFCYPAGRFDAAVIAAVRAAGYRGATTELPGRASARDDPYRLPRVRVNGSESGAAVVAAARAFR
jgi:peptidoglycan/xylan/chitin deacetylase (PgdA/CDA1 family)